MEFNAETIIGLIVGLLNKIFEILEINYAIGLTKPEAAE